MMLPLEDHDADVDWLYDEFHGWLPSPGHPTACAASPHPIPVAVTR
ncbi:hypothetical protein [Actinoplanes derwentensis]|uniref:Uncharacterized protein n=1 Tax=Actinoplanes derwentensis TaxID=113562 RepID=A0A1H2CVU3_9ACTN|nr:hypothetical protein [Actinoplanes derwentensis]SDT74494.1 hypothetical protein SAMN04489716_6999 [Actinoplanes derwentensis]